MPIDAERIVEQTLDRVWPLAFERDNHRHVLPIRDQWRMDRAGSGGLYRPHRKMKD